MEKPNSRGSNNFVVGLFVSVALIVATGFVVFMGGGSVISGDMRVKALFSDVRGLNVGAPVFLSGIQVGRVSAREFPQGEYLEKAPQGIMVILSIYRQHSALVKEDSLAEITTQGVLGDKVVVISRGSLESAPVKGDQILGVHEARELGDYMATGGNVLDDLAETMAHLRVLIADLRESNRIPSILKQLDTLSKNLVASSESLPKDLGPAIARLNSVLTKVDEGEGTLGALVNDATLHEDLQILLGGAQRSKTVRFLLRQAISANDEAGKDKRSLSGKEDRSKR